jgi:hypothetical protein
LSAALRPPARLRAIPDGRARWLRLFWSVLFLGAVAVVVLATAYSLRASYSYAPAFHQLGLDYDVNDGDVRVGTYARQPGEAVVPVTARLHAVDGAVLPRDAVFADVARTLDGAPGPLVHVTLKRPNGQVIQLQQQRRPMSTSAEEQRAANLKIGTRLAFALFACAVLLTCSAMLALRRPTDPVAMLFAVLFTLMAASVDPALQMWLWTGLSLVDEILANAWFYLLLIALAVFPDGVFVPRFLRWMVIGALPLVVFAALPDVDGTLQMVVAAGALLALLSGQLIRYRRLPPGIERQQIKWAAFGFGAGFVLLATAFIMLVFIPDDVTQQRPLFNLAVLVLFSIGIALIPLGLLVALTRFRLWEADTVITRSAAYAVVTVIVGVVWAASSDLVKLIVSEVIGHESEVGATTAGAIIAAGIFSPTQSAVLGWTRRRFGGPLDRIEGAAQRLKTWGLSETPGDIASRSLGLIDEAVHPACSAVVLNAAQGLEMIAARGVQSEGDAKLIETIDLADEEGSMGKLLLGRRSDGNRYNRQELEAVRQLVPHIADALRVARHRHGRESMLQQQIEAMAARLAQLEGGAPRPA